MIVDVNRNTSTTVSWPTTQIMTAKAYSWIGSCSRLAAAADVTPFSFDFQEWRVSPIIFCENLCNGQTI